MKKYKICPNCGKHNSPKILECVQCETDISSARVVDEETEKKQNEIPDKTKSVRMIRLCDCGRKNTVNARKCVACGEDISDITPSEESEQAQDTARCVLLSIDGEYTFEIVKPRVCIGRELEMNEYLSSKPYVSRRHAELIQEDGRYYIRNLSQTNYTYVNNVKIPSEMYELHDGDEIGLGGNNVNGMRQKDAAYFQVRIGACI